MGETRTAFSLAKIVKRMDALREWLAAAGAEVLEPTNEWEVLRFRAAGVTSVVYKNRHGVLTTDKAATKALGAFFGGKPWSAGVASTRRRYTTDERTLIKRDGDCCFLCQQPLGEDITVEHLVPIVDGGTNHIGNKALAHARCNSAMGHKPVMEKIRMREGYAARDARSAA